jgi:hypothetical protein
MKILILWAILFGIGAFIPANLVPPLLLGTFFGITWTIWYTND